MRASRGATYYTKKSLSLYLNSQSCLKAPGKTLNIAHSRFYLFNGSDEFFSSTIYDSTIRMDLDCFQPLELFGFVPSESFGFPVLANSNFLLPDCFCASPICFLRFSNDSFSVASCFSASERNFINTNWKHQSSFFFSGKFAHFTKYDLLLSPFSGHLTDRSDENRSFWMKTLKTCRARRTV